MITHDDTAIYAADVSEHGFKSLSVVCIARMHRHTPGVYRRGRVLRLDVVDDEQPTPVSKTTRVIFIINYMASAYGPLPASGRCPGTGLINKLTHGGGPRHVGWTHPSIRPHL